MKVYVERTWGWDECFQRNMFDESLDPTEQQILMVGGKDVGVLATENRPDSLFLANIRILPEHQRHGLGSRVIRDLLRQARREGVPVVLRVLKVNRDARRLYERLGFAVTGETGTHYLMRSEPWARPR